MRVVGSHPQRARSRRGLVAQRQLPDQRIDVGVLEERGERMPPALRTRGVDQSNVSRYPDERVADVVAIDCTRVAPQLAGDPQSFDASEPPVMSPLSSSNALDEQSGHPLPIERNERGLVGLKSFLQEYRARRSPADDMPQQFAKFGDQRDGSLGPRLDLPA